ncbi:uncharacterized protein LOC143427221 [Xylocopa sonorina]|uniref:uncharacterized protein LOC143427221 n=1 Tax=Xylocopa sonorina TaxID=1818115 RepID=UPI00403AE63B
MNNIGMLTLKLLRTYATKSKTKFAGMQGKKVERIRDFKDDFEKYNEEDLGMYEPNIEELTGTYINNKREALRNRIKLQQNIVKTKVFKERSPNFLTYIEKDQIKKLHKIDPEKWTPEKLSESFPALPETIRKILKTKWVPKSAERILQYDNKVIENWKQFKKGRLALSPTLKEHLVKFKDRKINLMDKEVLEQEFIPPKIKFPTPKSTYFSSIVSDLNSEQSVTKDEQLISAQSSSNKSIKALSSGEDKGFKLIKETKKLAFDEFLKSKINNPDKTSPEEKVALMDTYRKHIESTNLDVHYNASNDTAKDITEKNLSDKDAPVVRKDKTSSKLTVEVNIKSASLDTYIKERNLLIDSNLEYTQYIKIPKNVHKRGMTYRIKDCYYDDDGEFLYRVPGLKG